MTDESDTNALDVATPSDDEFVQETITAEQPEQTEPEALAPAEQAEEVQHDDDDEIDKRISRLAYEAREAKRLAKQLQRENEVLKGQRTETADEEVERKVAERAAALASQNAFNSECNKIYEQGKKEFGDFQKTVDAFGEIGGLSAPLVQAAIEAGDAHKVLHWLGSNLDEAERISNLDPARMGAAVAKVATKLNKPKQVSKAPAPIKPVSSSPGRSDENLSLDEWMRQEDQKQWKRR